MDSNTKKAESVKPGQRKAAAFVTDDLKPGSPPAKKINAHRILQNLFASFVKASEMKLNNLMFTNMVNKKTAIFNRPPKRIRKQIFHYH